MILSLSPMGGHADRRAVHHGAVVHYDNVGLRQVFQAVSLYRHAQRFEEQFYQSKNAPAAEEVQEETKAEAASQTDQEMLLKLLANPEMAALLKTLAKNL